jgi:hypothetical protein
VVTTLVQAPGHSLRYRSGRRILVNSAVAICTACKCNDASAITATANALTSTRAVPAPKAGGSIGLPGLEQSI